MNKEALYKLAEEYAQVAEGLLEEQGLRYTEEDVIKVAEFLIDQDNVDAEKTAEEQLEEIRLAAFYDELEKDAAATGSILNTAKKYLGFEHMKNLGNYLRPGLPKGNRTDMLAQGQRKLFRSMRDNPAAYGYGAVGTAGAAAFGAGRMSKSAAVKSPNQLAYDIGWAIQKALKADSKRHGKLVGLQRKARRFAFDNPKTVGYSAMAGAAAAAGGAGYGLKKALD